MKNDNFIMLPNSLVWNYETKDKTMINILGDKVPYIISYLVSIRDRRSYSRFSLRDIIESCGLKCKRGEGKSINVFKELLTLLQTYNYIECDIDFNKVKENDFIKCKVLLDFKTKEVTIQEDEEIITENKKTEFFKIDINEYYRLIESNPLDTCTLVNIYFYIVARLRQENNKARVCYMLFDDILNDLDMLMKSKKM